MPPSDVERPLVVLLPTLKSGGTEWQTLRLVRELAADMRIRLWVYSMKDADPALRRGFESLGIEIISGSGWNAIRTVAASRPAILLSYAINYYLPEILVTRMTGATLITERRNQYHWLNHQRRRIVQEALRNLLTRAVICNSNAVKATVSRMECAVSGKLTVIPNSVSPFTPAPGEKPAIIAMSNVKRGKGLDVVASAFADMRARHIGDDVDFAVYGRLDEPEAWASASPETVAQIYRGHRQREEAFSGAFALLHLSEAEGFPNAVLEAMSAGVIPILSGIPVHRELFSECALFADDAREAAQAMEKLIALHGEAPGELAARSQRCRLVAARYSLEARVAAYRKLLDAYRN